MPSGPDVFCVSERGSALLSCGQEGEAGAEGKAAGPPARVWLLGLDGGTGMRSVSGTKQGHHVLAWSLSLALLLPHPLLLLSPGDIILEQID